MTEEKPLGLPLREVLAPNASPMTGPGTTTFILGEGNVCLIDPGPEDDTHLQAILASLAPHEKIEAILITHPHIDHSALASRLSKLTGAPTYGFAKAGAQRSALMNKLLAQGFTGGGEGGDQSFTPDNMLHDGQCLDLSCGRIEVLHTPGHMAEHLSFAHGQTLFCGDLIMAWAPSLVSPPDGDMSDYYTSLRKITERDFRILRPTHGAAIDNPKHRIAEIIAHRRQREVQILDTLSHGPHDLPSLGAKIYAQVAPELWPAASRNALAHLIDLIARDLVSAAPWPHPSARFTLKMLKTSP